MVGFYLAAPASIPPALLSHTLLGIGLVAGGASALNMWLERRPDSDAADRGPPSSLRQVAVRPRAILRSCAFRSGAGLSLSLGEPPDKCARRHYPSYLPVSLYASQDSNVALHAGGSGPGRLAPDSRLDCRYRKNLSRRDIAFRDRFSLAAASFLCHWLDVSRGLCACGVPHAPRHRYHRATHGLAGKRLYSGADSRHLAADRRRTRWISLPGRGGTFRYLLSLLRRAVCRVARLRLCETPLRRIRVLSSAPHGSVGNRQSQIGRA